MKREKLQRQRENALRVAFSNVDVRVRRETAQAENLLRFKIGNSDIENEITLRKMLAQFEEYCEYENIFTGNKRAINETRKLNQRIQELVAETFKGVQFEKDY